MEKPKARHVKENYLVAYALPLRLGHCVRQREWRRRSTRTLSGVPRREDQTRREYHLLLVLLDKLAAASDVTVDP